ncbi:TetR/AcrR family transcriptional regulator [Solicola gregarius]|uniref:TetR/AcrR family transcriptional regulator n=1 Tax=Solicola gregarius TaxID=2908642 RepID=A0AA46YNC7_9ACTN|nr:TetR/AcrR family transcriptional regulator [Solicola gregarius]UYM07346.1 TetR/AcrR family transcriptional regulator [Solicola gregarius]
MVTVQEARTSGRVLKRTAILDAALVVFARDGYADAGMDAIAREAAVAKPTVYNHFADKESLFAAVLERYSESANAKVMGVVDGLDTAPDDVRSELERVAYALVDCIRKDEGLAVMRLQLSEQSRFPELIGRQREGNRKRTIDALAGKLAQLALGGRLELTDADRAARHLLALVSDEPLMASGHGNRAVGDDVVDRSVREGVDTFLAAFGPRLR